MQRNQNESFAAYKTRLSQEAQAVRDWNKNTRGGNMTTRQELRKYRRSGYKGGIKGIKCNMSNLGAVIKATFDEKQATMSRLLKHMEYVAHIQARKQRRATE